ncbi:MAG: hypothetical protein HY459_03670 [Parcubacteria group bacterium]|nr:hypothetical protein [Parcubacteria group bacterium]
MKQKQEQRLILSIIGFLLFAAGMFLFGLRPLYGTVVQKTEALRTERELIAVLSKRAEAQRLLKNQFEPFAAFQDLLDHVFLREPRIVDFVRQLESIAAATKVTQEVTLFEPVIEAPKTKSKAKKQETAQDPFELKYQLKLTGAFPDVIEYLSRLENLLTITDVDRVTVQINSEAERARTLAGGGGPVVIDTIVAAHAYFDEIALKTEGFTNPIESLGKPTPTPAASKNATTSQTTKEPQELNREDFDPQQGN